MSTALPDQTIDEIRGRDRLLSEAVRVLTDAARSGDFAEFVTHAVAGAAANQGGIEAVLAERPGSWESAHLRQMLHATVGDDEQYLFEHRTEPVVVRLHVDDLLTELGYADLYYRDSDEELTRREDAIYAATHAPLTDEQEAALADIDRLRIRLDEQLTREWAAYAEAFAANVHAAATQLLPGLRVPVEVVVEQTWHNDLGSGQAFSSLEFDLWERARDATPLPGSGILLRDYPPGVDIGQVERDAGRAPLKRLSTCEGGEAR